MGDDAAVSTAAAAAARVSLACCWAAFCWHCCCYPGGGGLAPHSPHTLGRFMVQAGTLAACLCPGGALTPVSECGGQPFVLGV